MLKRRSILAAKIEDTYGIDAGPTGAHAMRVEELDLSLGEGARMLERPAHRGSLAPLKQVYGGALAALSFSVPLSGSGAAGVAPEFGVLLKACGLSEDVIASTSVTYAPSSDASGHDSLTMAFYEDGTLYRLTGCRGTLSISAPAGEPARLSFTFTGHVDGPTDAALPTGTFDQTTPPTFRGASFTVDSFAATIASLTMDVQNQLATPPSVNAADGYAAIRITGRDVIGSIDPEKVLVATHDFIGKWRSGAVMALTTGVVGSTPGNRWRLDLPAISYREASRGDRDGIVTYELGFGASEAAGDDEFSLTLT